MDTSAISVPQPANRSRRRLFAWPWAEAAAWLVLLALLIVAVPLFLCMPLTPDVAFYDICARDVLRGRAPEKDFLFLPPPGMPWALAAVRASLGWSSLAVRAADLLIVAVVVALLAVWLRALGLPRIVAAGTVVALSAFYLSTTEWCHCQPDVWMFFPAVIAFHLRCRQVRAQSSTSPARGRTRSLAIVEGACWGAGCLIKPYVIIPGLVVWVTSMALVSRSGPGWRWRAATDTAGLLLGGLLAGALWFGWLLSHGAWDAYWQNYREFHGDYYADASTWQNHTQWLFTKMAPWGLVHLLAVPAAFLCLLAAFARSCFQKLTRPTWRAGGLALLSAFYLGWVYQASYVQLQFHYHLVPTVFLGMVLVAGLAGQVATVRWLFGAFLAFAGYAALSQSAFRPARLVLWERCWREGSSTAFRDRLSLEPGSEMGSTGSDLANVASFLRNQRVADGDLTCFHISTLPLYLELDVRPSTRYLMPAAQLRYFHRHRALIREEIQASNQRFLVTDMAALGLGMEEAQEEAGDPLALPPAVKSGDVARWPFCEPVVFRAGRYYVHRATLLQLTTD